jgi:hypothetical protein
MEKDNPKSSEEFTYLASIEKVVKDRSGHLHEDNFVCDTCGEAWFLCIRAGLDY